jgi:hypothetical protein
VSTTRVRERDKSLAHRFHVVVGERDACDVVWGHEIGQAIAAQNEDVTNLGMLTIHVGRNSGFRAQSLKNDVATFAVRGLALCHLAGIY